MRLLLIHQSPGAASLPPGATLWRTCLREVAFIPDEGDASFDVARATNRPVVSDTEAYALLLEIVCGLRSPLVGETEVQAQFKTFLTSLDREEDAGLLRLGQRVLADAKTIRRRYLQGFGARSYGHLAARHVPADRRVVLIGTGALAAEIVAALEGYTIDRWGRRVVAGRKGDYQLSPEARPDQSGGAATLVIAAPVSARDIAVVTGGYENIREVIDLRAADERTPLCADGGVVTLDDLFAEARGTQTVPVSTVSAARREILSRARAYGQREELHPFGWDDLCV